MPRRRFSGTAEELASALEEHVTAPTWLKYPEDMKKSKIDVNQIKKKKALLCQLQGLQPNLSFTQKSMCDAFDIVIDKVFREPQEGGG